MSTDDDGDFNVDNNSGDSRITKTEKTAIEIDGGSSDAKKLGEDEEKSCTSSHDQVPQEHSKWIWFHAFYHSVVVCIGTGILGLPYAVSSACCCCCCSSSYYHYYFQIMHKCMTHFMHIYYTYTYTYTTALFFLSFYTKIIH